jgi:hypothetical protein
MNQEPKLEKLGDVLNSIPILLRPMPALYDVTGLMQRYAILIKGYESFEPERFIMDNVLQLEEVLHDLVACIKCAPGSPCQTKTGNGLLYRISWDGMKLNGNTGMSFCFGRCPGMAERKNQIQDLLAGKGVVAYEPPPDPREKIRELKSQLTQGKTIADIDERRRRRNNEYID